MLNYADRRLDANLDLWRTGENLLQVEAHLPLDLALTGVEKRQIDGPLSVRAQTDSVSLGLLEAITPAVNRVGGVPQGGRAGGAAPGSEPRLAGAIDINRGSMSVPGLGVRFGSGPGRRDPRGRLAAAPRRAAHERRRPARGRRARCGSRTSRARSSTSRSRRTSSAPSTCAASSPSSAPATSQLRGPVFGATLTGGLLANSGVLYFADLVNKRIIDLEDPSIADLVDTTLIRRENLGAKFQNRFLDSLRIEDLRVEMGSDVWLRSAEANIQLEGRVRLSKQAQTYKPIGTLNAPRGHLHAQDRPGHPRLHGDPRPGDLHRRPQRRARHRGAAHGARRPGRRDPGHREHHRHAVRSPSSRSRAPSGRRSPRPIWSRTSSPATRPTRPPCSGQGNAVQTGLAYFSSALSSELERALIQDIGVPIDLIEIRPGVVQRDRRRRRRSPSSRPDGRSAEDVPDLQRRLLPRLQPVQLQEPRAPASSSASAASGGSRARWSRPSSRARNFVISNQFGNSSLYQIGFDILWEREF